MIINKKEKFLEVSSSEGYLLFLDGECYERAYCPLNVNPTALYTEITIEEAAALIIEENTEGEDDGDNNITNN